jgi:hypothetical protein
MHFTLFHEDLQSMSISLVRVIPEKVMEYWYQIRECIVAALPPYIEATEQNFLKIQEQLLIGNLHCWMISDGIMVYGVATTRFTVDEISSQKNLLLYTVTLIEEHPEELWSDGLKTLGKFAIANGCRSILAYSSQPSVLHIAKKYGGNVDTHLIQFTL